MNFEMGLFHIPKKKFFKTN